MVTHLFSIFSCPQGVYTDRGLEFSGRSFKEIVKKLGIKQNFTTSWSPSSNGQIERYNKTITEILRCLTFKQPASWDLSLSLACMAYNHSFNQSISESPYYIMFLRDPILPYSELLKPSSGNVSGNPTPDVRDYCSEFVKRAKTVFSICKSFSESQMIKRNARINAERKFRDIKVGDRIYLKVNIRRNKFIQRYDGPYRCVAVRGKVIYCYSLNNKKFKAVSSEKCRYAGDLFQDDDPSINSAFPEKSPLDDNDLIDELDIDNPVSIQDARGEKLVSQPLSVQSTRRDTAVHKSMGSPERKISSQIEPLNLSRGRIINHKYSLRSRA